MEKTLDKTYAQCYNIGIMDTQSPTLSIGDTVMWRGSFGNAEPVKAVVKGVAITVLTRQKHGIDCESVRWVDVLNNKVIIDLENGHWAYGEQIRPLCATCFDSGIDRAENVGCPCDNCETGHKAYLQERMRDMTSEYRAYGDC